MERNAKGVVKELNLEILSAPLGHVSLFSQVLVESIDPESEEYFCIHIGGKATINCVDQDSSPY